MPLNYCGPCGTAHTGPVDDNCSRQLPRRSTRSNPLTTAMDVKSESGIAAADDRAELQSLEDQVRSLETKKRAADLTARRAQLEKELAVLSLEESAKPPRRARSLSRDATRRTRRRRSTSHSSEERTPSRERRQRSKWALRRYTEDKKDVKKLNLLELIEASCAWLFDQPDLDSVKYEHFVKHIALMSSKGKNDQFLNSAHVHYDLAVRKLCVKNGFSAFSTGNTDLVLKYYAFENIKTRRTGTGTKPPAQRRPFTRDGKRPCYDHNNKDVCSRGTSCAYGHWCAICGSRSHKRTACTRD